MSIASNCFGPGLDDLDYSTWSCASIALPAVGRNTRVSRHGNPYSSLEKQHLACQQYYCSQHLNKAIKLPSILVDKCPKLC